MARHPRALCPQRRWAARVLPSPRLNLTSFQRWHKRLGTSSRVGFVELTAPRLDPSPWALEIELASGTILRLRG